MKERIFFIYPLSEDEEEETKPYNERGNTTTMAYYDKHGNTIEPNYQEQPEPAPTIEKHITIIYEASKPKVIIQEDLTAPTTPNILNPQEVITAFPNQPETTYNAQPYNKLLSSYTGHSYERLLSSYTGHSYEKLLSFTYGNQPHTEASQLASIRSELATITTATGTPTTQPGEIQAAA